MSGIVGSYFNTRGSGVVAKLGTDGQVFTSTGAGLSQGFEAAAGGGAWTFIKSVTASADSSIDFVHGTSDVVFDSTYIAYQLWGFHVCGGTDDKDIRLLLSTDAGSTWIEANYDIPYHQNSGGTGNHYTRSAEAMYLADTGTNTGEKFCFVTTFYNPSQSSDYGTVSFKATGVNAGAAGVHTQGGGAYKIVGDVDAFRIVFNTGTVASGTFKLYGLSGS